MGKKFQLIITRSFTVKFFRKSMLNILKINIFLKLIWNEFFHGGHLIPLGAVSIVFASAILLGIEITWDCLIVVYLGMQSAYLFNRYKELEIDFPTNPERSEYLKKNIRYIPFIVFFYSLLTIGFLIYCNKLLVIIFGLILFLVSLFYAAFFKKITSRVVGFKNFFMALMWSLLIIFLALYYSYPLNSALILILIFVYLKLFIYECVSDIKDIESDKKEGLATFSIIFKRKKLFQVLTLITILSGIPLLLGFYLNLFPIYSLMLLLTIPYNAYCFREFKKGDIRFGFLCNVFADGEFVLWSFLILFGKFFLW